MRIRKHKITRNTQENEALVWTRFLLSGASVGYQTPMHQVRMAVNSHPGFDLRCIILVQARCLQLLDASEQCCYWAGMKSEKVSANSLDA